MLVRKRSSFNVPSQATAVLICAVIISQHVITLATTADSLAAEHIFRSKEDSDKVDACATKTDFMLNSRPIICSLGRVTCWQRLSVVSRPTLAVLVLSGAQNSPTARRNLRRAELPSYPSLPKGATPPIRRTVCEKVGNLEKGKRPGK